MDDGARSARYTPLYTNSGFYFIRNNMRTQFFMHRMLMAYDTVLAVRSHQHALIMLLLEPVWKSTSACTKSFLGDDVAALAPASGEEPASPRHRAGRRVDGVEVDAPIQHDRAVKC